MKRFFLIACIVCIATAASAQKLVNGDKAPELKVKEWVSGSSSGDLPRLVEFFQSTSAPCMERLEPLEQLAKKYDSKLDVIVISRETSQRMGEAIGNGQHTYIVAIDDGGKTFTAYGVQYVPFAVLIDARGRIAWFGNPSSLGDDTLKIHVK